MTYIIPKPVIENEVKQANDKMNELNDKGNKEYVSKTLLTYYIGYLDALNFITGGRESQFKVKTFEEYENEFLKEMNKWIGKLYFYMHFL